MFIMIALGHHHLVIQYLQLVLLFTASSTFAVELYQTIPENNSFVCPGGVLQYSCTSNNDGLGWNFELDEELPPVFGTTDDINSTKMSGQFELRLTGRNGTVYTSTATNKMITSDYDNTQVECVGETSELVVIAVADGPASCSNLDVLCKATSNAADDSRTDISVYLTTSSSLMCVAAYQIQFKQTITPVSASLPSTTFTVSKAELQEQPFVNGMIYTLDAENRTGQVPCLFSVVEPTAVANIIFESECVESSLEVSVSWMPSEIEGCLDDDTKLEYIIEMYSSSFNNSRRTVDISYMLLGIPEGIDLEVTITPTFPDLGLSGSPLSTTTPIVKTSCVASSFPTTSSTTPSPVVPTGASNLGVVLGVLISILVLVVLIVLVALYCYCKKGIFVGQHPVFNRGDISLQPLIGRCLLFLTGRVIELVERQQKTEERFAKLEDKYEIDEQDNQNKEYKKSVSETHTKQGQRGPVKNCSEHPSDSGLAKTATEQDVDTQDDCDRSSQIVPGSVLTNTAKLSSTFV